MCVFVFWESADHAHPLPSMCVCVCVWEGYMLWQQSVSQFTLRLRRCEQNQEDEGDGEQEKKKNEGEEEGELKVGACVWVRERLCVCYSCESSWGAEYTRKDRIGRGSENSDGIMIGVLI